jgi:isopropylmalate/homocitrate/citramalate synthase
LNFSAAKSGLKQDGVIVDQETRVDFLPHSHGLERNAIYVQAGSA